MSNEAFNELFADKSDNVLACLLDHQNDMQDTTILKHGEYSLLVCSRVAIDVDGLIITGEEAEPYISESSYADHWVNNAWLEWIDRYGTCVGDIFEGTAKTAEEEIAILEDTLACMREVG